MTTINVDFEEFQINVETNEQGPAGVGITWRGAYSGATAYIVNDAVSYLGSSYICILASTNNLPNNATYWQVMASKGDSGSDTITTATATTISGLLKGAAGFIAHAVADTDYLAPATASTTYVAKNVAITGATKTKVTYDAKGLVTSGTDATTADIADSTDRRYLSDTQKTEATRNASGSQNGLLSSSDWTTFNSKQADLGFTPENVANKENTTLDTSATKYPTNRLVKEYADSLVAGLLDYRGGYDASVNTFPTTGGSGTAGAVIKGDMWVLSVAGTLGGSAVQIGDSIIANVDTPGQTAGNWNILNSNISYVPEDQANKETSALDTSVTKYPCNNVVKSAIEARYAILEDKTSDYTANSTNSGKMWMRSDEASDTMKAVVKTTLPVVVKALVVGGGGAGGAGGGGAGGYQYNDTFSIISNTTYPITIGAGGTGGSQVTIGSNGGDSTFSSITATGGGAGGNNGNDGIAGGSGGGGGLSGALTLNGGVGSQGNNGGSNNGYVGSPYPAGGGGGAGAVGGSASSNTAAGNGGDGKANSISGASVTYAGGGGGGLYSGGGTAGTGGAGGGGNGNSGGTGTGGTANTGGGGGGGGVSGNGGDGGSGIVIISYVTGVISATGGTITTSGGNTIHTFTSSGDFIVGAGTGSFYDVAQFPTKTYVDALISDTAYDATSWNGVTTIAPSKNAVRDKIETLVPYTGANQNVDIGEYTMSVSKLHLDNTPTTGTLANGDLYWNVDDNTANLVVDSVSGVTLNIGQEQYIRGVNKTGSQINDGQVVYINLTQGNRPKIVLAKADAYSTSTVIGVATQNIADNAEGFVTTFGVVHGYNTSGFTAGDTLYLSASTAGLITNSIQSSPNYNVVVGKALDSTNNGHILISTEMPLGLDGTFAGNSDMYTSSEKAIKTYSDTKVPFTAISDTAGMTGFLNNTGITVSYDFTTRIVTLTGTIEYYWRGVKKTLASGWTSSAHTATQGAWHLYSTDGTNFAWSMTPWSFSDIMVAFVSYGTSVNNTFCLREVHGVMDSDTHHELHSQIGTYRKSGGILTAGTYTENTATDSATTPGFDSAVVMDEDIASSITTWAEGTYTTMYVGASNVCVFNNAYTFPFTVTNPAVANTFMQVNNTSTGSMTNGINNRYYNVYQIIVPTAADVGSQKFRMIMLQPQTTFTSLTSAQQEDIRTLQLGNFSSLATEWVIYSRITYVTSSADTNTGKCRIVTGGVTYVVGNRAGIASVSGFNPTNHAGLTNLDWVSSGHTSTANTFATFGTVGESTSIALTAGQSVRLNAGGTALEAYTPSGLTWGSSINGATGTGVALAMDNSYASGGIGQSIIAGNTQTNALIGMKIDMGTSSFNHSGLIVNGLRSGTSNGDGSDEGLIKINSYTSLTQLVGHTTGIKVGRFLNSNSAYDHVGMEVELRANSSTGKNTGIIMTNQATSFTPGYTAKGTGISLTQQGAGGTILAVYGYNNVNSSSTGIVNYTLSNTQSGATTFQKIDLGTSTQSHIGLLVNSYNANTSCAGVKIDGSTTATGYGLEFAGIGASGYKRIRFSNQMVPAGGTSMGIHFGAAISSTTGTGHGIDFAGTISGGGGGIGRGIYCATIADNTGGGTGVLIQVDNLIGATSTTAPTSAKYYSFNNNQSAVLANLSVDPSEILFSRTSTRTSGTTTDNFNLNYLKRTSIHNGAGGTFSTTGSVQKLENVVTQTAGTSTDSTVVLSLVQDNDSTGGHILFNSYSGSPTTDGSFWFDGTNFKARVGGATKTFTIT